MNDLELCQFLDLGYHVIDSSTIPMSTHDRLFEAAGTLHRRQAELSDPLAKLDAIADNLHVQVPLLNKVLTDRSVDSALTAVLGSRYFRYAHSYIHRSGPVDQSYHKDSPLPWGTRGGLRSHRPNWAMIFYYPQAVTLDMGPTEILPGTQYWNVNREHSTRTEGEDRFDGTLGANAMRDMNDSDRTRHFTEQVAAFDRNVKPMRLVLPKGSLLLVHFDLFHRGTRRQCDDDRFMYKFWYVRTTEPVISEHRSLAYQVCDPRRQALVSKQAAWLGIDLLESDAAFDRVHEVQEADRMAESHAKQVSDPTTLVDACLRDDEADRRSAMYALVGHDEVSRQVASTLVDRETKAARSCAAFLLGELQQPGDDALEQLLNLVADPSDTDVRMTATNALGRAVRRRFSHQCIDLPEHLVSTLSDVLIETRQRTTRSGVRQSAERQCIYVALLNIVSSAAEHNVQPRELEAIASLLSNRISDETDRYGKSTALETLARLASMGYQQAVEASLKILRDERWSVTPPAT